MKQKQILQAIKDKDFNLAEDLWMQAIEDNVSPTFAGETLEGFVAAGREDTAETMGWGLLEAHGDSAPAVRLELAKAILLAVPASQELRNATVELYKQVNSSKDNFDLIWKEAMLDGDQRPKRALRTLDVCLAITPGCYMANRYDGKVIKIVELNAMDEYEFEDGKGSDSLDPKKLADEFDVLGEDDFRCMTRKDPEGTKEKFTKDIAAILKGLCLANGGSIDTEKLKATVVPRWVDKWSNWWSRARTAVKKTQDLAIEGRNPAVVVYHEHGITLEEELADDLLAARRPEEFFSLLNTYLSEANKRGTELSDEFISPIINSLCGMVQQFSLNCPADALEVSLMLEQIKKMDIEVTKEFPTPAEIIGSSAKAAELVAALNDIALQADAIKIIAEREDATDQFAKLIMNAPVELLDDLAKRLIAAGRADAVDNAVAAVRNDGAAYVDLLVWLWQVPEVELADLPGRVTLLGKILDTLHEIDHADEFDSNQRKDLRQKLRNALAAESYKQYKQSVKEMDEHVAAVIRTKIERTDGLAVAVSEAMLAGLREAFFSIFVKKKVDPWLDENVIWTTQAAYSARQDDLRVIKDELMPANAKQIGEAAEQGDLRENADWQAAIEERDMLVARVRKINAELARTRVLAPNDVPDEYIGIGSQVTLKSPNGSDMTLTFLGPWDGDLDNNIYSYTTGLAQNLMGKKIGEKLNLDINGQAGEFEIVSLESAIKE